MKAGKEGPMKKNFGSALNITTVNLEKNLYQIALVKCQMKKKI